MQADHRSSLQRRDAVAADLAARLPVEIEKAYATLKCTCVASKAPEYFLLLLVAKAAETVRVRSNQLVAGERSVGLRSPNELPKG